MALGVHPNVEMMSRVATFQRKPKISDSATDAQLKSRSSGKAFVAEREALPATASAMSRGPPTARLSVRATKPAMNYNANFVVTAKFRIIFLLVSLPHPHEVESGGMNDTRPQSNRAEIFEAADYIARALSLRKVGVDKSHVAIILGSGLGSFAESLQFKGKIPFSSIPHFPSPSTAGHAGVLFFGQAEEIFVCCIQGRIHYYEHQDMKTVTFPVRVLAALGMKRLVITNAAGGIKPSLKAGDLMLIRDHLGLFLPNPLLGANLDGLGPRFPDMSQCYSQNFRQLALRCARTLKLPLKEGIYAGVSGPSYETPAEIRMLKKLGADAVGMSTVPEVIVARHMGMECLGISCITNLAAGISKASLSHEHVLQIGQRINPKLTRLLNSLCHEIARGSKP
jgi:purine-nucleoside phosphorylase